MKISEFIERLEAIKAEHGDLEVDTYDGYGVREQHSGPEIAFRKVLSMTEFDADFWGGEEWEDAGCKGEKVCKV